MKTLHIAVTLLAGEVNADESTIIQAFTTADKILKLHKDIYYSLSEHRSELVEKLINDCANWGADKSQWTWMQASRFLISCGLSAPTKNQCANASTMIRYFNGNQFRKSNGRKLVLCPPVFVKINKLSVEDVTAIDNNQAQ
jgi:hypothetical protein